MRFCIIVTALLFTWAECFIIPEEFPSLLSLVYSNIPPVKKGTDSRIGLGFKLGQHADFQVLLELGPQKYTDPLGSPDDNNQSKREIFVMKNPQRLVNYFSGLKNYFIPEKKKKEKVSNAKWIDSWKNILYSQQTNKIEFNKVPGIDYPYDVMNTPENNNYVNHLKQLHKGKINKNE